MPVLIKVAGEGRVKMILGLTPYEQEPFLQVRTQINGMFNVENLFHEKKKKSRPFFKERYPCAHFCALEHSIP